MKARDANILLVFYLILLSWGILLKFALPPYFAMSYHSINLIPYQELARTWDGRLNWMEILLNIIAFLPLGFLIRAVTGKKRLAWSFLLCLGISLAFEMLQYLLAIGMADITDIIHNSFGAMLGILIAKILEAFDV